MTGVTTEPIDRRWLRIIKMRGGNHRSGKHTFRIGPDGVEVFPRIETLVPQPEAPLSSQIPSGIPGLDDLMYVTFQDTSAQLTSVAASFGWDLAAYRDSGRLAISYVPMGDLDLDVLATSVRSAISPPRCAVSSD